MCQLDKPLVGGQGGMEHKPTWMRGPCETGNASTETVTIRKKKASWSYKHQQWATCLNFRKRRLWTCTMHWSYTSRRRKKNSLCCTLRISTPLIMKCHKEEDIIEILTLKSWRQKQSMSESSYRLFSCYFFLPILDFCFIVMSMVLVN